MFNNIFFILHKPQLSENIGACARAMKNFNFSKLIVINPKPIFPNDKIIATSVGAQEIIKKSKVYENLEPAMKNIDFLISTTSRFRNKNIKHIKLNELTKIDFTKKVAFLFGPEASGLSNNEISFSNYVLQIPSNTKFKSLNLSHSLIIVAQAVFQLLNMKKSKFFIALAHAPIFSDNWGLCKIKEILLNIKDLQVLYLWIVCNLNYQQVL